jgi:hypothetical protein
MSNTAMWMLLNFNVNQFPYLNTSPDLFLQTFSDMPLRELEERMPMKVKNIMHTGVQWVFPGDAASNCCPENEVG